MDNELNNLCVAPDVFASGLMVETNGQPCLTDAGLFAMAGILAHSEETDSIESCMNGFLRALTVARACGLDALGEAIILRAFAAGYIPGDGSEEGTNLAHLCKYVARLVGVGRMSAIIEGRKAH